MISKGIWEVQEYGGLFTVGTYDEAICKLWELEEETHDKLEFENAKDNACLIAEAGTIANETGLTPKQLAEHRKDLLDACKACVAIVGIDDIRIARKLAEDAIAKAEKKNS